MDSIVSSFLAFSPEISIQIFMVYGLTIDWAKVRSIMSAREDERFAFVSSQRSATAISYPSCLSGSLYLYS